MNENVRIREDFLEVIDVRIVNKELDVVSPGRQRSRKGDHLSLRAGWAEVVYDEEDFQATVVSALALDGIFGAADASQA